MSSGDLPLPPLAAKAPARIVRLLTESLEPREVAAGIAEAFADQAALALDNARLHAETRAARTATR